MFNMETNIEMVDIGARGGEARAPELAEGVIETGIDRITGAPSREQDSIETGLERTTEENKVITPAEAAYLENIDLGASSTRPPPQSSGHLSVISRRGSRAYEAYITLSQARKPVLISKTFYGTRRV
jgi:hypothetical protein